MNRKIFAPLLMSCSLFACGPDLPSNTMELANQYSSAKDYPSAIIVLKNMAKESPEDAFIREQLGIALINNGQYRTAENVLERALDLGGGSTVLATLCQIKYELKKFSEVYPLAGKIDPDKTESYLQGNFYAVLSAVQEEREKLAKRFLKELSITKEDSYYLDIARAWTALASEDLDEALFLAQQALKKKRSFPPALFLTARISQLTENYDLAITNYEKYLAIVPNDYDKLIYLYQSQMSLSQFHKAKLTANKLYEKHPEHPLVNLYMSQVSYEEERFNDSIEFAQQVLTRLPKHHVASLLAGASSYQLKNYKDAYRFLRDFGDVPSRDVQALLQMTMLKLGMLDEVTDSLKEFTSDSLNLGVIMSASTTLARNGNIKRAIEMLDEAILSSPDDAELVAQLGLARLSINDSEGIMLLEKAIRMDSDIEGAKLALALAHIRNGDMEKAEQIAENWAKSENTKVIGQLMHASILSHQEKHDEAKAIYESLLSDNPKSVSALFALGVYHERAENLQQAIELYKRVISEDPEQLGALERYSFILKKQNRFSEGIEYIEQLTNEYPDSERLMLFLALSHVENNDPRKALAVLARINPSSQTPDIYWLTLGDASLQRGLIGKAIESFRTVVDKRPTNYSAQIKLIQSLESAKRYTAGINAIKKAKAYFKDDERLSVYAAHFYNLLGDGKSALLEFGNGSSKSTSTLLSQHVMAKSYLLERKYAQSLSIYETLYANTPEEGIVINIATIKSLMNDKKSSVDIVNEHISKYGAGEGLINYAAELNYDENPAASLTFYRKLLETKPEDFVLLNNLANVELKLGHFEAALLHSEKSYRIKPTSSAVANTYGTALFHSGNIIESINVIEKALEQGSTNVEALIVLATAYDTQNQFKKKIDAIKKAYSYGPTDSELKKLNKLSSAL